MAAVSRFVTPLTVLAGAFTAAAAAAAYFYSTLNSNRAELATAAGSGAGRFAGVNVDDLNAIAIAASATGKTTIDQAQQMSIALLRTGNVSSTVFKGIISLTRDYAAATGQDATAASKQLVSSFGDLSKGVNVLQEQTRAFTAEEMKAIQQLARTGDTTKAAELAIEALNRSIEDFTTFLGVWGRAVVAVSRDWEELKRLAATGFVMAGRRYRVNGAWA